MDEGLFHLSAYLSSHLLTYGSYCCDWEIGDFTRIHGFHKPAKGQNIIFYCRSGKRAQTAIDLAKRSGYRSYAFSYFLFLYSLL